MNRRLVICGISCVMIVFLAMLGMVWTKYKRESAEWQTLSVLTNSSGQRFEVAQKSQLLEGAGWKVVFEFVDSDKKLYGSLLELETFPPWRNVRIIQTNETVEIWRDARLVGTLSLSERVFRNALDGSVDKYVEGFDGVQGQMTTNHLVDVP